MQITSYNNNISPQFKAVKVATATNMVKNFNTKIDIYKINPKTDNTFLSKWKEKVNIHTLFPKLPEFDKARWQQVFEYSINSAADGDFTGYIAVQDNKPCGIISYLNNGKNNIFIDGVCSVPVDTNKKIPLAGTTLIYQAFKDAQEKGSEEIVLDAVNNGPFNIIEKYKTLGFKINSVGDKYTNMRCKKYQRDEQLKNLEKIIDYESCSSEENIDLCQFID